MPNQPNILNANDATTELRVAGMTCNNCVRHVTAALQEVPDVASVETSLDSGHAVIKWRRETPVGLAKAIAALKEAGYEATPAAKVPARSKRLKLSGWQFNAVVGSICTGILLAGEWVFNIHDAPWFRLFAFILASIVQVFCGGQFYRGAWNQLKARRSNMDTLVALGSSTAYLFSLWALLFRPATHLYFTEAAGIITFVSIGHWLEARVSSRASTALRNLLTLAPQKANRREPNGAEIAVPVSELRLGDLIVLRPGDGVPTDGEVISGDSSVNESMLTGEALPITKTAGHKLCAGTLVVDGQLVMRVTAIGQDTALAHIIAAVQRAQNSRAEIQRIGDVVSSIFVPIVILCAVATGLWWGFFFEQAQALNATLFGSFHLHHLPTTPGSAAFIYAAAVLIVACPCAMGLATPIAIMAGTNAAAARGILIRDGIALEKAGKISAVIFDKTGTLTEGTPSVSKHEVLSTNQSDPSALTLAASVAQRSNHPLSRAIAALTKETCPVSEWQEIRGSGVQGKITGNAGPASIRLGSLRWLDTLGIQLPAATSAEKWMNEGATVLGLAIDQNIVALFALKDTVKRGAAEVIHDLSEKFSVYLVTGDNQHTARLLAQELGIPAENVAAEIRPENKAEFVKQLQARGERVAFVGDGINDAPALEQADLGIAVAKASDIASEAADMILLQSDIHAITETLGLAAATLRTVKQNLFWAFFYNAASIPLAALGFLSPMLCAAAMGVSDLIVVGNALRLRGWRPRR